MASQHQSSILPGIILDELHRIRKTSSAAAKLLASYEMYGNLSGMEMDTAILLINSEKYAVGSVFDGFDRIVDFAERYFKSPVPFEFDDVVVSLHVVAISGLNRCEFSGVEVVCHDSTSATSVLFGEFDSIGSFKILSKLDRASSVIEMFRAMNSDPVFFIERYIGVKGICPVCGVDYKPPRSFQTCGCPFLDKPSVVNKIKKGT